MLYLKTTVGHIVFYISKLLSLNTTVGYLVFYI